MYLIIGLGNPGAKYILNRHNMGYWVIDELSEMWNIPLSGNYALGIIGSGNHRGEKVMLVKPVTYMNSSGLCVLDLVKRYKVPLENVIVAYDDMDLPVGKIRLRMKGGPGTHNGMKSIVYELSSEDFPRVRLGIGRPEGDGPTIPFVLGNPKGEELKLLTQAARRAADSIQAILDSGLERAMQEYNKE